MSNEDRCCESDDKEVWSRDTSDEDADVFKSYASIDVTNDEARMTLCLGGRCVTMSIEQWHEMAMKICNDPV